MTLIELFAWMTDQLLYRLNRVPDRNYIKFLELIGVRLFPPTAARTPVTFWLSAPRPDNVTIPTATQVATERTDTQEAIIFSTTESLDIVSSEFMRVASRSAGKTVKDHTDELNIRSGFFCFDSPPKPGNELLIGLSKAVPSNIVNLGFECHIEGVGVDPTFPPLAWDAWTASGWVECELESDTTGGLNKDGSVLLHVPRGHTSSVISQVTAGWLRARVTEALEGQPTYSASPEILGLSAFTIGGTADAMNAQLIINEVLGTSEGVAGQRFQLLHAPVVAAEKPLVVEISEGPEGWQEWAERPNFAASGPADKHFVIDAVSGEIQLGLAVRLADGALRNYGAVPLKGSFVRVPMYRSGGGAKGNVAAHTLSVLKASIPYIERVENRKPGTGGVDGEDLEAAKIRGPILLRTRDRAVTAEDYEHICREAAPEVARVKCLTGGDGTDAGVVKVLLVPAVPTDTPHLPFEFAGSIGRDARASHAPARRDPRDRHTHPGRTADLPRRDHRGQAQGSPADRPAAAAGSGARRAVQVLPSDHRRPRRPRLAVRPAGHVGRGLLGTADAARHGAGGGGAHLWCRPGHRRARQGHRPARR